jgi:hypothetical protein
MIPIHGKTCQLALILSLALSSSIIGTVAKAETNPYQKEVVNQSTIKPIQKIKPTKKINIQKVDILRPNGGVNTSPGDFKDKNPPPGGPTFGEGGGGFVNFTKPGSGGIQSNPAINQQKPSAAGTLNQIQKR